MMQEFICYYTFMDNELYVTLVPAIELCYSCMNGCNSFYFMENVIHFPLNITYTNESEEFGKYCSVSMIVSYLDGFIMSLLKILCTFNH